jgi:glucose-1-phosphate adenylyltransferase
VLPPRAGGPYAGTADAVARNSDLIRLLRPDVVLVLSGDHVYRADYSPLVEAHLRQNSDVTVLADEVAPEEASSFGVLVKHGGERIVQFVEKPRQPRSFAREGKCAINLGVYCFRPEFLADRLEADREDRSSCHDFGKDILPRSLRIGRVTSCPLKSVSVDPRPYWKDAGTVGAYFDAHLDLLRMPPRFALEDRRFAAASPLRRWSPALLRTRARIDGQVREGQNLVSQNAQVESSSLVNCVISQGAYVGARAVLDECVVLPGAHVGPGARLRRVIVEEGTQIAPRTEAGFRASREKENEVLVLTESPESVPESPSFDSRQETVHPPSRREQTLEATAHYAGRAG